LRIGGEIVISGHIDEIERSLDAGEHGVAVTGRDATADLVDCAALNQPGEWKNRDAAAIAKDICAPFGVGVETAGGARIGAAFETFTLQKGETAGAAIQRLCAARGLLAYSDGRGILLLGPGKPGRIAERLVEGVNIKKITAKQSRLNRWRDYTVFAQSGQWGDAESNAGTQGRAHDAAMRRYRPTARLADDLADGITAADQAGWDAMIAKAKATAITVTIAGWRHAGGVWRPNHLVEVSAKSVQAAGDYLISAVDLTLDDKGGIIAQLTLTGPGAFDLLAAKADKKGGLSW
jgi:prophage tail gpP-like protein